MTRYLQLSFLGLCLVWAPAIVRAQADEPPAPPQEPSREADAPRDSDRRQPRDPREERRRARIEDEIDRLREGMNRHYGERFTWPPRHRFGPPEIPRNAAWLGVQLTPVPTALAHHLRLEDKGVMIANIFEGSPADKAGLDRYDIIIMTDGKPTPGGFDSVHRFSESVRDKRPGETLELTVVRRGQEKAFRVELGTTPPDWSRVRPKYTEDPDVAFQREFGLRGRIFRPGPGGDWIIEDLERFPLFRNRLERELRSRAERRREAERRRDFAPRRDDSRPDDDLDRRPARRQQQKRVEEARRVDREGNTLHVQRDEDGRVTVRRYKAGTDPDRIEVIYENMDQLRQADREAYELLQSAIPTGSPHRPGRPHAAPPHGPDRPATRPFEGRLPGPRDRGPATLRRDHGARPDLGGPVAGPIPAPPRTRFEVSPDGKITVQLRHRDTEMTRTFNSREELRREAPELFEQFGELESRMKSGSQRPEDSQ